MQILLLFTFICIHFAEAIDVQCSNQDYGRSCVLESSPEIMKIIDDQLFVGTANSLQVFQLMDLQNSQGVDLNSDPVTVDSCTGFGPGQLGNSAEDCKNYIRTIQPYDDRNNSIMVCGTNSYNPECTIHMSNQLAPYTKLSGDGVIDDGYSPNSNTHSIVAHLASNGRFFSATRFGAFDTVTPIRMSPGPHSGDSTFTVGTPLSDPRWLNQPNFISVYEHGEHMYFFLTEPAYEVSDIQEVRYSRVIRICKTDDGISADLDPRTNHFLTFQKARMICSVEGEGGSIPFYYDNLQSTFLKSDNGSAVLYGVFNSPTNGPLGGAICKFSFNSEESGSITEVFGGMNYLVQERSDAQTTWVKSVASPFTCPGSGGLQRTVMDSETYQLQIEPVTPTQALPLYISPSEFLDKIVVDSQRFREDDQEILYFTNLQGDLQQVVLSSANSGTEYRHTILKSDGEDKIKELIIHHKDNNERSLIASTESRIVQIHRGRCSSYANCFSCFDSKDAYCGWHPTTKRCINKYAQDDLASALVQSFSADEAAITEVCGARPPSPTAPPLPPCLPSHSIPDTTDATTDSGVAVECTTKKLDPGGLQLNSGKGISIPIIAGATVAAFVVGIPVGCLICAIFFKRFTRYKSSRSGNSSLEAPKENVPTDGKTTPVQVNNNKIHSNEEAEVSRQPPPPPPSRYTQHTPATLVGRPNGIKHPDTQHTPATLVGRPNGIKHPDTQHTPATLVGHPNGIKHPVIAVNPVPPAPQTSEGQNSTTAVRKYPNTYTDVSSSEQQLVPGDDNAFIDNDTLPPLRSFSPGTMYGSLGRNKSWSNGITRKQAPGKLPRGRSDSTTWLRQRSESLSSDISSTSSPLQSPISDV